MTRKEKLNWILTLVFAILVVLFIYDTLHVPDSSDRVLENGKIDMRGAASLYSLSGEWRFVNDEFVLYDSNIKEVFLHAQPIRVPGSWADFKRANSASQDNAHGYGTYMLHLITEPGEKLGFDIPFISSNYKLYMNDNLIAQAGKTGMGEFESKPERKTSYVSFTPDTMDTFIIMQVSNYHDNHGGIINKVYIGPHRIAHRNHLSSHIRDILVIGTVFLFTMYHITLVILGKRDIATIYFIVISVLLIILQSVHLSYEHTYVHIYPEMSYRAVFNMLFICVTISIFFIVSLFRELFPNEISRVLQITTFLVSISFLLTMPFLSTVTLSNILYYSQIHFGIVIILLMFLLLKAVLNRREGSFIAFIGEAILGYTCIHDILLTNHMIDGNPRIAFGFLIFTLCTSYVLSQKYTDAYRSLEKSVVSLQKSHQEIIQQHQLSGIGQLAAGVAHEINNPLGFTVSNIDIYNENIGEVLEMLEKLINNGDVDKSVIHDRLAFIEEDNEDLLSDIESGLNRISRITSDLWSYTSIKNDKEASEYIDLNDAIDMTLRLIQYKTNQPFQIAKSLDSVPKLRLSSKNFNQVFLSLLNNAIDAIQNKYDSADKGVIRVRSFYQSEHICVEVEDNGIGVEASALTDIFNPFYSTKSAGVGAGLGLSVANQIIKDCGGKITVSSEVGIGSVFRIWLPVNNSDFIDKKGRYHEYNI